MRPPRPHAAAHRCPPHPHAATRTRRRTPHMPALGGGRQSPLSVCPHSEDDRPRSEEDTGRHRQRIHARRRTALAATGPPMLLPLACPLPPPAEPLVTTARSPPLLGHLVTTPLPPPPPIPLANLLLLEKNCDYVKRFREVKFCFVQNHS
jgi:hypothetical protein